MTLYYILLVVKVLGRYRHVWFKLNENIYIFSTLSKKQDKIKIAQLAGAVEYTDCFSAER